MRRLAAIEHARMKLATDGDYRLLHLTVASLFARELQVRGGRIVQGVNCQGFRDIERELQARGGVEELVSGVGI